MRSFIRHPIDIPIEYRVDDGSAQPGTEHLKDVGGGGLSFFSAHPLAQDTWLTLHIDSVQPDFRARARVVWCHAEGEGYLVGVAFADAGDLFQMRMVEQLCHIEQYKTAVMVTEGRQLDMEQAAREWIGKFAGGFPAVED